MNLVLIKEALGIPENTKIKVNRVGIDGWNIRVVKSPKKKEKIISFREYLISQGVSVDRCAKCGKKAYTHPHHIVPKSAGGLDDVDNGVLLCFECHVGDNGIHNHVWDITDIVPIEHVTMLKKRYEVTR